MPFRIIGGLLVAAILYGCDGSGFGGSNAPTADAAVSGSGTATTTPITLHGTPPSGVNVGSKYSFQPTVSSSSGSVTFAIEGLPAWADFDASTGLLSGTPNAGDVGLTGDITITATDGTHTGSVGGFAIRVYPLATLASGDLPPVISGTAASVLVAGQSYIFQPVASDAAGRPLTYAISNRPVWASFSTATGKLSGTPAAAQIGRYTDIDISVSDGISSAALPAFSIAVLPEPTDTPVITGTAANSVTAGQTYSFQPSARDPQGRPLTFSIVDAPPWASFNLRSGNLSGKPSAAQAGTYAHIVITASNGTSRASLPAFTITVGAPAAADAPVIGGVPATSDRVGMPYSFRPVVSGPAGKALTFSILNRPTWASFNTATGLLSGTPTGADIGSYPSIGIRVSDGASSAALPAFNLIVSSAPSLGSPTISGTPATSVVAGNTYHFSPAATNPTENALTFSIDNAPNWAEFSTATGELSGTPTEADVGTYANITIRVSDGKTAAALPSFPIAVTQSGNASVTLSWTAPTENTNGTPLTNLAGYWIHYGTSPDALTKSVQIANPGLAAYVLSNLSPGTWYFSMTAYSNADVQSPESSLASHDIG
jgi:hypothetical protein